ncbi:DUF4180 domain-containing protein [Desnuesiella massiliensis]|uniref:DUF4180 domain-containing protein n=1 Tax=Desnuesiella massiliensis TaxID=1650662 RepID=UPI0006E31EA8|nr:DUF4180 domain-containing protein [Desnuesiella massiliensis]
MNYQVIEKDNKRYIKCASAETPLRTERDALDLIAASFENNTPLMIIHEEALSEDFFNLRTGLAGTVLQKFMNYHIKVAAIISSEEKINDRFREMALEANKGNDFRVYKNITEAENWILNLK